MNQKRQVALGADTVGATPEFLEWEIAILFTRF